MPKLSIGVIGVGAVGAYHLKGYAAAPKTVQITAICDINKTRLDEMGETFGVAPEKRYRDYKKMLANESLDAVSVCVPNKFHFEIASDVIQADINILLEKPITLTLAESRKLQQNLQEHPVKFMVAFSHRFFMANAAAKKLIDKNAIGKPYMMRVRYAHTGPYPGWAQSDWFYKKNIAGGGAMLDMGIHAIDICQYFIGPIETVQAEVKTLRKKIQVDDNAIALFDFGKQAQCLGYMEVGWTSSSGFTGIEVFGDKGSLRLPMGQEGVLTTGITKPDGSTTQKETTIAGFNGFDNWPLQMESFIKFCLGKKTVTDIPGIDAGHSSLAVALAAFESAATGKRIKVKR